MEEHLPHHYNEQTIDDIVEVIIRLWPERDDLSANISDAILITDRKAKRRLRQRIVQFYKQHGIGIADQGSLATDFLRRRIDKQLSPTLKMDQMEIELLKLVGIAVLTPQHLSPGEFAIAARNIQHAYDASKDTMVGSLVCAFTQFVIDHKEHYQLHRKHFPIGEDPITYYGNVLLRYSRRSLIVVLVGRARLFKMILKSRMWSWLWDIEDILLELLPVQSIPDVNDQSVDVGDQLSTKLPTSINRDNAYEVKREDAQLYSDDEDEAEIAEAERRYAALLTGPSLTPKELYAKINGFALRSDTD